MSPEKKSPENYYKEHQIQHIYIINTTFKFCNSLRGLLSSQVKNNPLKHILHYSGFCHFPQAKKSLQKYKVPSSGSTDHKTQILLSK